MAVVIVAVVTGALTRGETIGQGEVFRGVGPVRGSESSMCWKNSSSVNSYEVESVCDSVSVVVASVATAGIEESESSTGVKGFFLYISLSVRGGTIARDYYTMN
jgi:hypothetical protein